MTAKLAPAPDTTAAPEPTGLECWREDLAPRWRFPIRLTSRADDLLDSGEPFLSKKALAAHFDCSERTVSNWMREGMPKHHIDGRVKLRISECTTWLRQTGHLSAGAAS